jgi:hypothetical protein
MRTRKASCALERPVSLEERGGEEGGGFNGIPVKAEEGKGRGIGGSGTKPLGENGVGARPTGFRGCGARGD